jgi:hypothetical protein
LTTAGRQSENQNKVPEAQRDNALVPEPLYVGDDHCVAIVGPVIVTIVHHDPHPDILKHQQNWLKRLREVAPDGSGFIVVLQSNVPPPPEPLRAVIRRTFDEYGKVVRAGAMVVEGTGFAAAALRGVLAMIHMAARHRYPFKVFGNIGEASAWITAQIGRGSVAPRHLAAAVDTLKKAYAAGAVRVGQ